MPLDSHDQQPEYEHIGVLSGPLVEIYKGSESATKAIGNMAGF
jgi:hypothetical protein